MLAEKALPWPDKSGRDTGIAQTNSILYNTSPMQESAQEKLWVNDYYGHAPFPGGRFVDRVPVNGTEEPWADPAFRHVSRRWLGPVQISTQGIVFYIRYVGIHEHTGHGYYPLHTHPHSEFIFTLSGKGSIHVPERDTVEPCTPGHLVAFPPSCAHQPRWSLRGNESWKSMVVDFDIAIDAGQILVDSAETVDMAFSPFYEYFFVQNQSGFRLKEKERKPAMARLSEITRSLSKRQYGICSDIVAGLLQAISLFSRSLRKAGLADGRHLTSPLLSKDATLLKARALMEQGEMLDAGCVDRIARTIGMSSAHFIREFCRLFGTTPKQYSQNVLMRRAAAMMARADVTIKEAAFHFGYENPTSFSRAFVAYHGISPVDYRNQHRPGPPS